MVGHFCTDWTNTCIYTWGIWQVSACLISCSCNWSGIETLMVLLVVVFDLASWIRSSNNHQSGCGWVVVILNSSETMKLFHHSIVFSLSPALAYLGKAVLKDDKSTFTALAVTKGGTPTGNDCNNSTLYYNSWIHAALKINLEKSDSTRWLGFPGMVSPLLVLHTCSPTVCLKKTKDMWVQVVMEWQHVRLEPGLNVEHVLEHMCCSIVWLCSRHSLQKFY